MRLADPRLLESTRLEIRALCQIRHPNVVRIVASGVTEGLPWYAMELLEGLTFRRYARSLVSAADTVAPDGSKHDFGDSAMDATLVLTQPSVLLQATCDFLRRRAHYLEKKLPVMLASRPGELDLDGGPIE